MKRKNISLKILTISVFVYMFLGIGMGQAAVVTLGVPETIQEHSNWCWAASSKAVLDYYGSVQTQCAIANWAWGRNDCCGNNDFNWSHACNQANCMYGGSGCIDDILSHWGVSSSGHGSAFSWDTVVARIDVCRPFVIRFGWTGGGGHFLVGYGYDDSGNYVYYMDPWPGNGYTKSLYSWTASASDHTWTHTLEVTTSHACTSCPSLYFWNGSQFEFVNSIFPGTVIPEVEYAGSLLVKGVVPEEGMYFFEVREEELETSRLDMAKLIIVDRPVGTEARYQDSDGKFVLPEGAEATVLSPVFAFHSSIGDVTSPLCCSDNWYVSLSLGDSVTIKFQELPGLDKERDFIFVSEGYYTLILQ